MTGDFTVRVNTAVWGLASLYNNITITTTIKITLTTTISQYHHNLQDQANSR